MTDGPPPALPPLPALPALPALPTLGPVARRPPPRGARREWQDATVVEVHPETSRARTVRLALPPTAERHVPGQHYVVRVRRDDGSWAQRSYSVASAPPGPGEPPVIDLTVELLEGGELSAYLHALRVGDEVSVRGPFGGWFLWRGEVPAVLVGGGSGIVPLMSMLRFRRRTGSDQPLRLVVSVRDPEDLYYRDELAGPDGAGSGGAGEEVLVVHSRRAPAGSARGAGRLTAADLAGRLLDGATYYVCGSAGFADHATQLLTTLGVPAGDIRVEQFGPG